VYCNSRYLPCDHLQARLQCSVYPFAQSLAFSAATAPDTACFATAVCSAAGICSATPCCCPLEPSRPLTRGQKKVEKGPSGPSGQSLLACPTDATSNGCSVFSLQSAVSTMRQLLLQLCLSAASVTAFAPTLVVKGRFTTQFHQNRAFHSRESHARVQKPAQAKACSSAASNLVMRMEGGVQPAGFPEPGTHQMFCVICMLPLT
jgi:hypothetical protein